MMLSVQQQQHYHHGRSPTTHHHLANANSMAHRGNVIVTASNNNNTDIKTVNMQQAQTQQQQQLSQSQQKRKMYAQTTPYTGSAHQPASVARRNARERNRVKQVNNGFATLRQHIPQSLAQALGNNTAGTHGGARAGSKKLSKVETLRMAVEYIRNLQRLLEEHDSESSGSSSVSSSGSPPPTSTSSQSLGSPGIGSDLEHHHQPVELKFELKSESSDDDVQDLVHQHHHMQHHQHHHHHHHHQIAHQQQLHRQSPVYVPAPSSEASCSPTPSFVSEASSAGGSQGYGTGFTNVIYTPHSDGYDNYEPMSPEDEELLDYISMWQQGQ